jgi:hypothetical protein
MVTGGTVEANDASKHSGSYGCEVTPLVGYRCAGYKYAGSALTRLRQAFYFNPNSLAFTDTRYFILARNYHDDAARAVYKLTARFNNPNYQLSTKMFFDDGDESNSGNITISDDWHLIEMDWISGSPGSLQLWIDGVDQGTLSGTNSNLRVLYPALGVCEAPLYAFTGSFYLDNWRANDDGGLIGA